MINICVFGKHSFGPVMAIFTPHSAIQNNESSFPIDCIYILYTSTIKSLHFKNAYVTIQRKLQLLTDGYSVDQYITR